MEFLEFATALNVSAGGMLIAIRRAPPLSSQIKLEIPSAPLAAPSLLARVSRKMSAKALRSLPAGGFYLLGLKFSRPLLNGARAVRTRRRKLAPAV